MCMCMIFSMALHLCILHGSWEIYTTSFWEWECGLCMDKGLVAGVYSVADMCVSSPESPEELESRAKLLRLLDAVTDALVWAISRKGLSFQQQSTRLAHLLMLLSHIRHVRYSRARAVEITVENTGIRQNRGCLLLSWQRQTSWTS